MILCTSLVFVLQFFGFSFDSRPHPSSMTLPSEVPGSSRGLSLYYSFITFIYSYHDDKRRTYLLTFPILRFRLPEREESPDIDLRSLNGKRSKNSLDNSPSEMLTGKDIIYDLT